MKDAPKTIYLQVFEEDGCDSEFFEHEGVTWCQDKINDTDIEYTRSDLAKRKWVGLTEEELVDLRGRVQEYTPIDSIKYGEAIQRFMEQALKEKNSG